MRKLTNVCIYFYEFFLQGYFSLFKGDVQAQLCDNLDGFVVVI